MAEIKIEKKGGIPAWVWIILAIIVIAILAWVFLDNDRGNGALEAPNVVTQQTAQTDTAATGPITDLTTLAQANGDALVGRQVQLSNVQVAQMAGDASFYVTDQNGQREYVVLNEQKDPATAAEGRVNVNANDMVNISGEVRSAANSVPDDTALGSDKAQPIPKGVNTYIYAQSVQTVGQ